MSLYKINTAQTFTSNEKIVKFQVHLSEAEIGKIVQSYGAVLKRKIYGADNVYVIQDKSQSFNATAVAGNSKIEYTETNHIYHILATSVTPNDPDYTAHQTWNYGLLKLPQAWAIQKGNSYIIVAVIDIGISLNHPVLTANLVSGYDFVDNDTDPSDNQYYDADNMYRHGTHVAGIIGAVANNGIGGRESPGMSKSCRFGFWERMAADRTPILFPEFTGRLITRPISLTLVWALNKPYLRPRNPLKALCNMRWTEMSPLLRLRGMRATMWISRQIIPG